jgi:glycosyltransferase involved in cell wall biosynthesis
MTPSAAYKISVCIVTYRRDDDLMKSLQHLGESSFEDFEILIVDNGASPGLQARINQCKIKRPIRLVQAPENRGCASLNLLFPDAKGEVIACFDDDSYPHTDCLDRAWEIFRRDPSLGMIGFKMLVPETGEPWHDPWWNPNSSEPHETVFCPGCGLAFRNDPRLPRLLCIPDIVSQAHELSMAAEIARLGYRIEFRPDCLAYHPDTTVGYSGSKAEAGSLNQLRFLLRYSDPATLRLLVLTHWLVRLRGLPNHFSFIQGYLRETPRNPLSRNVMRRFREVLSWHVHPWLKFLIPS